VGVKGGVGGVVLFCGRIAGGVGLGILGEVPRIGDGKLRCLAQGFYAADCAHVIAALAKRGNVAVWWRAETDDASVDGRCAPMSAVHML